MATIIFIIMQFMEKILPPIVFTPEEMEGKIHYPPRKKKRENKNLDHKNGMMMMMIVV